jgi:hypothetical protein
MAWNAGTLLCFRYTNERALASRSERSCGVDLPAFSW